MQITIHQCTWVSPVAQIIQVGTSPTLGYLFWLIVLGTGESLGLLTLHLTMVFIDENIPGGVMRGAEWHSHLGSMKVCFGEHG